MAEAQVFLDSKAERTHGNQAAGSPLFRSLLDHLQKVTSIFVVSNKMGAIDDHNQWFSALRSPSKSNFFELIKSPFNIQQGGSITGTPDAEKASNIAMTVMYQNECAMRRLF
jgi:hypothetical protein